MNDFLSTNWIQELASAWNNEPTIVDSLAKAHFTAKVGYGIIGEKKARCYIQIENGIIINSNAYTNQILEWDLRASTNNWRKWLEEDGFGLSNMGPAVALGRLKFVEGDYRSMIKNPKLAVPFLQHFDLMSNIPTNFDKNRPKQKKSKGIFGFFKR